MRDAALVGGPTRWHVAGWWGGAGRTDGDRYPRLWCAWDTSAFCSICPIVRPPNEEKTATLRMAPCCESRSDGAGIVHAVLY